MKKITLLIMTMFFLTSIFAGTNKNKTSRTQSTTSATLECTQKATYTSTGSYACNGIPYSVSVSAKLLPLIRIVALLRVKQPLQQLFSQVLH